MQTGFQYIASQNKTVYYNENGQMLYGFQKIGNDYYYFDTYNGAKTGEGQRHIDGHWYLFGKNGIIQTGFQYIIGQNKTVYYNEKGQMLYGFQKIGNDYYYFDTYNGAKAGAGEKYINNHLYLFDKDGKRQTGFIKIENKTVYYNSNGEKIFGEQRIDGHWYYFQDGTGKMLTGFQYIKNKNKTVYYNENGQMLYGYTLLGNNYYYFSPADGSVAKDKVINVNNKFRYFNKDGKEENVIGQKRINNHWYLFDNSGIMQTGFQYIKEQNKTVYYNSNGEMLYGEQLIDGAWRYFDKVTGAMATGFTSLGNKVVYYDKNGKMIYGNQNIDGINYYFNTTTGAMKDNFIKKNGNIYYYSENGTMATGWNRIAGTKYYFNDAGEMIGKNVRKVIDISAHNGSIDWNQVKNSDIDGVILRVGYDNVEDKKFSNYIADIKKLNIPYGIYLYNYGENESEGKRNGQFVVDEIKKYSLNPTLGIYFDLESNNYTNHLNTNDYNSIVKGFMNIMNKNGYGKIARIYTYRNYARDILNSDYLKSKIYWVAEYNSRLNYSGNYSAWQYTSSGSVSGISTRTDISVWFAGF